MSGAYTVAHAHSTGTSGTNRSYCSIPVSERKTICICTARTAARQRNVHAYYSPPPSAFLPAATHPSPRCFHAADSILHTREHAHALPTLFCLPACPSVTSSPAPPSSFNHFLLPSLRQPRHPHSVTISIHAFRPFTATPFHDQHNQTRHLPTLPYQPVRHRAPPPMPTFRSLRALTKAITRAFSPTPSPYASLTFGPLQQPPHFAYFKTGTSSGEQTGTGRGEVEGYYF